MFGAVFAVGVAVMTRGARLQAAGPAVETLVSPRPVGRARSRAGGTRLREGERLKRGTARRKKRAGGGAEKCHLLSDTLAFVVG